MVITSSYNTGANSMGKFAGLSSTYRKIKGKGGTYFLVFHSPVYHVTNVSYCHIYYRHLSRSMTSSSLQVTILGHLIWENEVPCKQLPYYRVRKVRINDVF
jgi:hypothetical protein